MSKRQSITKAGGFPFIKIGVAFAATALFVRWVASRAEKKYPPKGKFITVDGVRLHYSDSGGSGFPVVLFHGNAVTHVDWRISGVTDKLAGRYRVIAFDRPGFGYSERPRSVVWTPQAQADLFKTALRQMGITKSIVVGHSWGGLVAAAFAIRHPESTRGAVLVSGYYFPTFRADSLIASLPAIPIIGDILRYTVSPLLGMALAPAQAREMFAPRSVTERFAKEFPAALALRPSQIRATSAEAALMLPAATELEEFYSSIKAPVVIISGDEDQIVDVNAQSVRLHKLIPQSELRVVPGLGHMVHHFVPMVVAGAIDTADGKHLEAMREKEMHPSS